LVAGPNAFSGKLIYARRRCAAQYAAAVTAKLAISEIVHQDEHDVGLRCSRWRRLLRLRHICRCSRSKRGRQCAAAEEQAAPIEPAISERRRRSSCRSHSQQPF
jgi:hypothetical protein